MSKDKIIFKVEKINTLLIRPIKLYSENEEEEFIMLIYHQFGFRDFKELRKWVDKYEANKKEGDLEWMQSFTMTVDAEATLLREFLRFYPRSRLGYKNITDKYNFISLNYGARNIK